MAYPPTMAAALSGATVPQLRHWRSPRTGPLLGPEISAESRIIYSFRDLLALRTFVHLRQNASLQRIRKAVSSLRDFGEIQHLASYQLVSDAAGNIRLITGDDEIEPRLGTFEEVGATDEAGYLVVGADDCEELRHPAA